MVFEFNGIVFQNQRDLEKVLYVFYLQGTWRVRNTSGEGNRKITVSKWGFRDLEAEVRKGCSQAGVSGQTDPPKKTQEQEEYYGSVTPWDTLNTS